MTFPTIPLFHNICSPARNDKTNSSENVTMETKMDGLECESGECDTAPLLDLICPTIRELQQRHNRIFKKILQLKEEYNLILPDTKSPRRARGLFNIVGEISKSLFGTATTKDQDVLTTHIEDITDRTSNVNERLTSLEDSLGSYLVQQTTHDELIERAMTINEQYINLTAIQLQRETRQVELRVAEAINFVHLTNLHYTTTLNDIYLEIKSKVDAVHDLLRGYLPKELVSVKEMKDTITHVASEVSKKNSKLTHVNHAYYYHVDDIDYKREGNLLFIKVKLPISQIEALFRVYHAQSIALPIDNNEGRYSQMELEFNYLAINSDETVYALLTEKEYFFCKGNSYKRCDSLFKIYTPKDSTCLYALFTDHARDISKLCTALVVNNPNDFIFSLNAGEYYVNTQDTNWIQTCDGKKQETITACKHCVVTVPCACSLRGHHIRIPRRLEDCLNSTSPTQKHAINLPALLAFYGESAQLLNLSANRRFKKKVSTKVPTFKVIRDEYTDVVAKLKTQDISLQAVAEHIKSNRKTFASPSAKLRDDLGWFANKRSNSIFGVSGLSLIVAFLALFVALRNARIVMLASGATALVLDPETTTTPGTSAKPSYSPILTLNAIWTSITVVIILISLAIILIFVKRFLEACYAQQPNALPTHSVVYVFFYAKGRFAMSQLFIFPDDINTVRVCQRDEFKLPTINVTNCGAIYTATFDWNFLDIRREDGKRIYLPPKTTFSSLTTRHLNNTLRDPCEVKMVANYNHCFFDLFTWRRPEAIPTTTISSSINPAFRLDDEDWERMAKTARVV